MTFIIIYVEYPNSTPLLSTKTHLNLSKSINSIKLFVFEIFLTGLELHPLQAWLSGRKTRTAETRDAAGATGATSSLSSKAGTKKTN